MLGARSWRIDDLHAVVLVKLPLNVVFRIDDHGRDAIPDVHFRAGRDLRPETCVIAAIGLSSRLSRYTTEHH